VIFALLAAAGSAVSYGFASVLQAIGAKSAPDSGTVDPRLLARLVRQTPFVIGILFDMGGAALQFIALRTLPLFLVQATQSANLAVTAVLAVPLLKARLYARHWWAVVGVCAGLAMLAFSAGEENAKEPSFAFRLGLLACVAVLTAAGLIAGRLEKKSDGSVLGSSTLGAVAGLGFGLTALGARSLTNLSLSHVIRDPALYAIIGGGVTGFLFFATGLQRGAVTAVSAAVVVGETALPALVGVLALGDHTRPGFAPLAVIGFLLAVAGALALSRFGEPTSVRR
jgi:drug/metabolite transporter (DMT)-like permease